MHRMIFAQERPVPNDPIVIELPIALEYRGHDCDIRSKVRRESGRWFVQSGPSQATSLARPG
jgi:hypothetical protein